LILNHRNYNLFGYTEYESIRNINNNLSLLKNNTDKNKYNGEDLKTVVSNSGFNVNNINDTPLIDYRIFHI
jgi:hypothetical protein